MGEMAATRKAELEQIKQFVSKQSDSYRAAYARRTQERPRQCAFFGTTNDDEFLRDATGGRRFWPVTVTDKGRETGDYFTPEIVDQVWAEIMVRYNAGEVWYTLVQGMTLAGVLFDEVALMPRSFVEQALARCSVAGSKFWFNCNPEGPMHWFYKEWVLECKRRNVLHLHFTMADNLSLSEKIKQRYEGMYTGVFYARYILGKWTKAEGLVYPFFDAKKHMIDDDLSSGRYYISCDYGTLNPCVFGLWRVKGNSAFMVKEYYYDGRKKGKQKTDEEYYADLEAFADGYLIEQVVIDPSAASFKETIRRHGKFSVKNAKNGVLDGIRDTGTMLQAGLLHFNKTCVNTKAEFGAYAWDEKSSSDAVIKENDHSMDQMRYFVRTIMKREVRAYGIK